MTTDVTSFDWASIRDEAAAQMDEIKPVPFEVVEDAIIDVEGDDVGGTFGLTDTVQEAVDVGVLRQHGESDDPFECRYSFDVDAVEADEGDDGEDIHIRPDGRQYAPEMVDMDNWLCYREGDKTVVAPWKTNSLHNASWGEQLDPSDRPETDFRKAVRWAESDETMLLDGPGDVDGVHAGFLLQREVSDDLTENIVLIDLDDVRSDDGEIIDEAQDIIDRLDSYGEVSMSGNGVHVFVNGRLPEWYSKNRLVEPLNTDEQPAGEQPKIEIYHRRRIAITTGDHMPETPEHVHERQDVIEDLVDEYGEDLKTDEEKLNEQMGPSGDRSTSASSSSSSSRSPYFDIRPSDVVTFGSKYRKVGNRIQGPHPEHGSSQGDSFSEGGQNFSVEDGVWHCYRHGSGGNGLQLLAVLEDGPLPGGFVSCDDCGGSGKSADDKMSDAEFALLCMTAREKGIAHSDWKPPYRAVLGVCKMMSLCDEDAEEIPAGFYELAREKYDELSPAEMLEKSAIDV